MIALYNATFLIGIVAEDDDGMSRCNLLLLENGIVAIDDADGSTKVVDVLKFNRESMAREYSMIKSGLDDSRLSTILSSLKAKGYTSLACNDPILVDAAIRHGFSAVEMSAEDRLKVQHNKVAIIVEAGLAEDEQDAFLALHEFSVSLSSIKVAEASAKPDQHIIQCINTIDELDKIVNIMGARLREWYGLHFPELDGIVQSLPSYCDIVLRFGRRDAITVDALRSIGLQDEKKVDAIARAALTSKGGMISDENLILLQRIAEEIKHLSKQRDALARHMEDEMARVAPNLKDILGATIGARMIAKAGGLERLALLPASTIQVLGAEKALFRALRTGTRPPKHGIIFQHPSVHSAPRWQRGKIARAIATKVAVAARIDAFTGTRDDTLLAKLNERLEEIREKYVEPRHEEKEEGEKKRKGRGKGRGGGGGEERRERRRRRRGRKR
ncbi:putative pre-mRNA processing ribonucleoprotein, snoRNA-binding domain protein [Candidatus Nitrosocaldus cavascurensis]|uniref:Putative pre-mRNA processing ribonucleoprotein, snoRNA-binding domain protein n=2 Tax=Candidatus Nitrosocaldaceae TaxID=1968910 RepID=A0A2K5AQI2_9ARCH|nr:putative pre-mRNA processing ribonucleoprotein, snoRNA-binding domain protein [Candidatus Nitrosocaldus cavascurensis]